MEVVEFPCIAKAFQHAHHYQRYAHRTYLVWEIHEKGYAAPLRRSILRRMLLDLGSQRHGFLVNSKNPMLITWPIGILMLRQRALSD